METQAPRSIFCFGAPCEVVSLFESGLSGPRAQQNPRFHSARGAGPVRPGRPGLTMAVRRSHRFRSRSCLLTTASPLLAALLAATLLATSALLCALRALLLASLFCCHAILHCAVFDRLFCPRSGTALLQHIYCHLMSRVNTTCCCVARRCVHVRKNGDTRRLPRRVNAAQFATLRVAKITHRIYASNH